MRSTTKLFATGALAFLFMPAVCLNAAGPATPAARAPAEIAVDSSSADAIAPAQSSDAGATSTAATTYADSRVDLAVLYSYVRAVPTDTAGNRLVWLHGGSASINFHLNRMIGIVGDFGGYADSQLRVGTASSSPHLDSDGKVFTYMFGPRFTFASQHRISPYLQILGGGIYASSVTLSSGCGDVGCTPLPSEKKFALAAGGGLDAKLSHHVSLRIIQAEYLMTRFTDLSDGSNGSQNDMRLSSGLVFRFGGARVAKAHVEPPPVAALDYSCSAAPSSVYAGEGITVSGNSSNLASARPAVYSWSNDQGTIAGDTNRVSIDTAGAKPGTYTVKGHLSDGAGSTRSAVCDATYEVKAFDPPSVTCTAFPTLMAPGQEATITTVASSPQNRPLTYSYRSTSGTINGSGSTATLVTTGANAGTVSVYCNVADDVDHTATSSTMVTLAAPQVAAKPAASELCSIHFERDAKRPSRVDNEAKACLDEIAMNLQKDSDATVAIVGDAANGERNASAVAGARAKNAKAYLVTDKGIDASRIKVYSGKQDGRMASTTLIPSGADFDSSGVTPIQ